MRGWKRTVCLQEVALVIRAAEDVGRVREVARSLGLDTPRHRCVIAKADEVDDERLRTRGRGQEVRRQKIEFSARCALKGDNMRALVDARDDLCLLANAQCSPGRVLRPVRVHQTIARVRQVRRARLVEEHEAGQAVRGLIGVARRHGQVQGTCRHGRHAPRAWVWRWPRVSAGRGPIGRKHLPRVGNGRGPCERAGHVAFLRLAAVRACARVGARKEVVEKGVPHVTDADFAEKESRERFENGQDEILENSREVVDNRLPEEEELAREEVGEEVDNELNRGHREAHERIENLLQRDDERIEGAEQVRLAEEAVGLIA